MLTKVGGVTQFYVSSPRPVAYRFDGEKYVSSNYFKKLFDSSDSKKYIIHGSQVKKSLEDWKYCKTFYDEDSFRTEILGEWVSEVEFEDKEEEERDGLELAKEILKNSKQLLENLEKKYV